MDAQFWEEMYGRRDQVFSGAPNGVLVNETRPRTAPAPPGTHHTHDTVLRAQRTR